MSALLQTNMPDLKLLNRGKVRDLYDVQGNLLLVASDRLSAFDVIMNQGIPGKGRMLTELSLFWFDLFKPIVGNHLISADVGAMPAEVHKYRDQLEGRTMYCKRAEIFQVECVVRGYIVGSGWKDYQKTGEICGHKLPAGLQLAQKLPQVLFTPATKAPQGQHDENIDFETMCGIVGKDTATELRELTIKLYTTAADYAAKKGIIIADTKFEFGLHNGRIILCDEVLTPDSSRFWDARAYKVGTSPESFDKQIVRDWLEKQPWNKKAPAPDLPPEIVKRTADRYAEVVRLLKS
ncbi:MAG: phosphoribosylaminoimidazolesuccinocarboxamide synthase [Planctomycetes bacterium]|nr:phosphoribosylaminoimidazolesuccinocarboxamide synthase [Planctomycetota bacterium]MCW8134215.1 phosphoribosylaminoimidazolesuccinocarboxamide synthase [Planctomycetota bacterium]